MASASRNPYIRWTSLTNEEITVGAIRDILYPLQDDIWVAAACFDRLVSDNEVQRVLLQTGFQRTDSVVQRTREAFLCSSNPERGIIDVESPQFGSSREVLDAKPGVEALVAHFREVAADAQLCYMRGIFLDRLDRLDTFEELSKLAPGEQSDEVVDELEEWEDDPWGTEDQPPTMINTKNTSVSLPISLPEFLTGSLLSIACLLATMQWFNSLRVLFERHKSHLWPHRFTILDSIPDHAHPTAYRDILPSLDTVTNLERQLTGNDWRSEEDWSEREEVMRAVKAYVEVANHEVMPSDSDIRMEPLTSDELVSWYKHRVERVICSTGLVDTALAIIQHGASQGVPGLDELGEELSLLSRLVYDVPRADEEEDNDKWNYTQWKTMDPPAVIHAYLRHSTPATLATDISRLVMPYLFVLESRAERAGHPDPDLPNRLLYEYLLTAPLEMAVAIFEASKPTLSPAQRLIRNDEDMARLALACLYGSNSLNEWPTMSRIFECLPAWDISRDEDNDEDVADTTIVSLGSFVTPSTSHTHCTATDLLVFFKPLPLSSLSRALDILDVHLESGEILSRWSVPAPLQWFLQSHNDAAEQRAWATRMARRAGGTDDQLHTLDDWEWLLEDMLKLTGQGDSGLRGAFGLLSRQEIVHIFLSGLLSTGRFGMAKELIVSMQKKHTLDPTAIENICLECSREFYDNASSGNYNVGDMKLAYDCLDVPPPSERMVREKEFIEATSRLSSFNVMSQPGIPITPIEIRLTKDRLSLISRVLSSNANAYKHVEVILDLVYKLGFRDDMVAEIKTLAMLADTALQAEDFERAYEVSQRMVNTVLSLRSSSPLRLDDPKVQEASEVCWIACFQLGRQPEFQDVDKKLCLLGRALELCSPDKLHDVLTSWRRLEKEDIDARRERLAHRRSGTAITSGPRKQSGVSSLDPTASLRARLKQFHMPSPPLLSTPDAAALASRTFRTVFPFSVGNHGRSQASQPDETLSQGSRRWPEGQDVSTQATRVFSKGIGWLIGADDE